MRSINVKLVVRVDAGHLNYTPIPTPGRLKISDRWVSCFQQ